MTWHQTVCVVSQFRSGLFTFSIWLWLAATIISQHGSKSSQALSPVQWPHNRVQTRNLKIELTPFAADMQTISVKRKYVHDHTQLLQQPQLPRTLVACFLFDSELKCYRQGFKFCKTAQIFVLLCLCSVVSIAFLSGRLHSEEYLASYRTRVSHHHPFLSSLHSYDTWEGRDSSSVSMLSAAASEIITLISSSYRLQPSTTLDFICISENAGLSLHFLLVAK